MTYVIQAGQQPFVISTAPDQISVVSVGVQGPAGPPGSSTVAGATFPVTAGSTISAYTVVGLIDGLGSQADSSNLNFLDTVCGIATAGTQSGASCQVQYTGSITYNGWNWTLGQPIFFATNGTLTHTPPTTGFLQQVGFPLSATTIIISFQPAILLA